MNTSGAKAGISPGPRDSESRQLGSPKRERPLKLRSRLELDTHDYETCVSPTTPSERKPLIGIEPILADYKTAARIHQKRRKLTVRIELTTPSIPRKCSTVEPCQRSTSGGSRTHNLPGKSRLLWPIELRWCVVRLMGFEPTSVRVKT